MLSRRHIRYWATVTGVLLVASFALAGKPAPTPIIATTTDENFLTNVVDQVSSQTTFNLAIDVSGTGTHYRYQIGPAATINPSDSAAYSSPIPEATPLTADITANADGDFVLCLQALQIDKKGNIKYVQSPATVYPWVKDTPTPAAPAYFDAIDGAGNVPLLWLPGSDDSVNYLVVRRTGEAVVWQPTDGQVYTPGDLDGGAHRAIYVGTSLSIADVNVVIGTTYYYTVFACSVAHNYSQGMTDHATPTAPSGGGNFVWYPAVRAGTLIPRRMAMDDFGDALKITLPAPGDMAYNTFCGASGSWAMDSDLRVPDAPPLPETYIRDAKLDADTAGNYMLGYFWSDYGTSDPGVGFNIKMYSVATGWQPVQFVDEELPIADTAYFPNHNIGHGFDLALCPDGTAMAVWQHLTADYSLVVVARRFDGTEWGPTFVIGEGGNPYVASDDNGHFMLVYEILDSTHEDYGALYHVYYNQGWQPASRLTVHHNAIYTMGSVYQVQQSVRIRGTGDGHFVALYRSNSVGDVIANVNDELHARAFDGTAWGPEQQLDVSSAQIYNMELAISGIGTAIAIWQQNDAVLASHFDGISWDPGPTELSYIPDEYYGIAFNWNDVPIDYVTVTMDAAGNGIAVFAQFTDIADTNTSEVYKIDYNAASRAWDFSTREALSTPEDGVNDVYARIVGNSWGEAVVVWKDSTNDVRLSRQYSYLQTPQ